MTNLTATLNLRVPAELRDELERQAAAENRKPSDLHRLILASYLTPRAVRRNGRRRV